MDFVFSKIETISSSQLAFIIVILCFILIVFMLIALFVLIKRAQTAENTAKSMLAFMQERLDLANQQAKLSDKTVQEKIDIAMQNVNDTILRTMDEITRTQQGQVDTLSGQLRAIERQEEEHTEHMRQIIERRICSFEEKFIKSNQLLEQVLQEINNVPTVQQASFSSMIEAINQITANIHAIQVLNADVDEFEQLFSSSFEPKKEIQVGSILSKMLAPEQYQQNANIYPHDDSSADYVISIPEQSHSRIVYLPIDISFPTREYQQLCDISENGTYEEIEHARERLKSAIQTYADGIAKKLIAPPHTTNYAILFLPSEDFFAEVFKISGLFEQLKQQNHIILTGPAAFTALIANLKMRFNLQTIEQKMQDILPVLNSMYTDLKSFSQYLNQTQKNLKQASQKLEQAQQSIQTFIEIEPSGIPKSSTISDWIDDDTWD